MLENDNEGDEQLTEPDIKEQISTAYLQAMSSDAGIICWLAGKDYGIDGRFKDVEYDSIRKRYNETGFGIDFQVKASVNVQNKKGYIVYDLEVKNYLDLIKTNIGSPRMLILYSMPRERNEWVHIDEDRLVLKKCAWWCSLKGLPAVVNRERVRIRIPDNQILTSDELVRLMKNVKTKGGIV